MNPHYSFPRLHHNLEPQVVEQLAELCDLFATRELLRWELQLCDLVERWVGSSETSRKVRAAVQGIIDEIQDDFEECFRKSRHTVATRTDTNVEVILLELYLVAYKFANPPLPTISALNSNNNECGRQMSEQSGIQRMVHTLHQNNFAYSDADFMCAHIWNPTPCFNSTNSRTLQAKLVDSYRNASAAVGNVLWRTVPRNSEHRKVFSGSSTGTNPGTDEVLGYPVYHLAIMHGPALLSSELCKVAASCVAELDCLRRTPVHAAVYTGKVHELKSILAQDNTAVARADKDIFGLTPLMIAACKDDVKTANLLLSYGAAFAVHDLSGMNILALATRNDSQNVVSLLLNHGHLPPSLHSVTCELREAITHDRKDIVNLLVRHYNMRASIDESASLQIKVGVNEAKQRGLHDIAAALETLGSNRLEESGMMSDHSHSGCGGMESPYVLRDNLEQSSSGLLVDDTNPHDIDMHDSTYWGPLFDQEWLEWPNSLSSAGQDNVEHCLL